MPVFPRVARHVRAAPGRVYGNLAARAAESAEEVFPLHVGDTWMEPAVGCRMEDLSVAEYPGMHRYAPVQGRADLVGAIVERARQRTGVATGPENVLVAAGGTGALGAWAGAVLDPGDEVLILAPHWPLIAGIVRAFHGVAVQVPFIGVADGPESAVEIVERARTGRTVALYVNTPNNPTGAVIPPDWLAALADWAARHDLWIVSDETYEDCLFEGRHEWMRRLAPERTVSCHSFSKAFGMAGNRCGYLLAPADAVAEFRKVSTHTFYSTPTAAQIAALRALDGRGDTWAAQARRMYADVGVRAAARLGVDPPQGSTFLFLDVADALGERGLDGFLNDCADRGLLVAPGTSFGAYPTHVRVCFTSAAPDRVMRGVEVLARLLGR